MEAEKMSVDYSFENLGCESEPFDDNYTGTIRHW